MATHGAVSVFDPNTEDWTTYTERMKYYFVANDVTDANKKHSILLSACGPATYKVIRNLVEESKLDTTSFDDIVKLVKGYYDPPPSVTMQRYKFNTRVRSASESVADYVAALREIAQHCEYKESLQDMLRDRLVCGVNHEGITNRLLAEKKLNFDTAMELAQAIESAERDTRQLQAAQAASSTPQVHHSTANRPKDKRKRDPPKPAKQGSSVACYRCGGPHLASNCRFIHTVCHACKKRGHIAKVCRSKGNSGRPVRKANNMVEVEDEEEVSESETENTYQMFTVRGKSCKPIVRTITINGVPIPMELDTGAAYSVITQTTYQKIAQQKGVRDLEPSDLKLKSYSGQRIKVFGQLPVVITYEQEQCELLVQVVDGEGPDLMGRDWMAALKVTLSMGDVYTVEEERSLHEVLAKHSPLFTEELGCLKGMEVKLNIDPKAIPKFFKARTVPLALKEKVERELEKLQSMGIISPVQFSRWAAPIVPVIKQSGEVRICGDYKITVNQACSADSYPLPRVDELLANLAGGQYFSKLDLSQAYLQLPLEEESREYVTVNTHKGLYKYNRLPFGVSAAPSIFQRTMENLLQGIRGVSVYIDDILITGSTLHEHLQTLDTVLEKLQNSGLKLNRSKCYFLRSQIEYLGHVIDREGLHPTAEKVRAIQEARKPQNISELRSFFGIINYYNRFLPNLSTTLTPLYRLLQKDVKWTWGQEQEEAFTAAKKALQDDSLLVHYDESKPLILACDASKYGLGAVLSHVMGDGTERPVAYASRTLTTAEKNYSQLEKEGLAIIFGTKKFHNYLYGRHFSIESDHQPLSYLFNEAKGISPTASSRIQRWTLTLSAYQYTIRHKAGKSLGNADTLSRLPRPVTTSSDKLPGDLAHLIDHLSATTVNARAIKDWTSKDPVLSQVRRYIMVGWPNTVPADFKPYQNRSKELSTLDGCVLWGARVVVPPQGRASVLEELHETHPGCTKMKALARSYIWWPKMDQEIEEKCRVCQESRASPPPAPLHPWQWPTQPWARIHLDFAGPYMGHTYLIIVDASSKWLDAHIMSSMSSEKTIETLRTVFATHGLPQMIVTDNGSSFTSEEFRVFTQKNGIKHVTSAPYHPSSNGQAERAVQTVKQGLKRTPGKTIQEKLSKFLFKHRLTPHATTGIAPCELLMKRKLRSALDLLFPTVQGRVEERQIKQKTHHDGERPLREFAVNDRVYVENFPTKKPRWIAGTVVKVNGPLSYEVELENGTRVRRHVDSVREREEEGTSSQVSHPPLMGPEITCEPVEDTQPPEGSRHSHVPGESQTSGPNLSGPSPPLRRSNRPHNPPERYGL